MSKKTKNFQKMPLLTKRLDISNSVKKHSFYNDKEYTQLGSLSPRFMNLYSKYIKSKQRTIYPNIRSILNDYRAEKLNKLSEQEAMREEIGEEIKKYKDIHDLLKRRGPAIDKEKYFDNFAKKNRKKLKENRGIILDTFYRYENSIVHKKPKNMSDKDKDTINIISPYKVFKTNKNSLYERIKNKYNNKTAAYFNTKKILELIDTTIKVKPKTRDGKKIRIKDCWDYCHKKLNTYCDNITDDSIKIKINGRKTMEKFNNTWNKYKLIQEFKFPETKRHIFEQI